MQVAYNVALIGMGFPPVDEPETPLSADDPGLFVIDNCDSGTFVFSWPNTISQDQTCEVFASQQLSQGRNGRNVRMTKVSSFNMNGNSSEDIFGGYAPIFGAPQVGAKIVLKIQIRVQQFPIIQFPFTLIAIAG